MNLRLHIERVVLDGLDLSQAEAERVRVGLEAELSALLQAGGLSPELLGGGAFPTLGAGSLEAFEGKPQGLASQTAQAVYRGIGVEK
jgi:hypothetical protein